MPVSPVFVLETALYADDLEAAQGFYRDVLRLEVLFREEGRHVFFRCGTGVLLLFHPEATRQSEDVPPHGAEGAGHVAFAVQDGRLEEWQVHFAEHDIPIERDKDWGDRGRSLYVRDPAGNSVELATPTLWGTATRDDRFRQLRPPPEAEANEIDQPVERFQQETLQPLLDLLTPTILQLVADHVVSLDDEVEVRTEDALRDRVQDLLENDEALRHTLFGTLLGHVTADELEVYFGHRDEIQHRFCALVRARLQERTDAIAERIGP